VDSSKSKEPCIRRPGQSKGRGNYGGHVTAQCPLRSTGNIRREPKLFVRQRCGLALSVLQKLVIYKSNVRALIKTIVLLAHSLQKMNKIALHLSDKVFLCPAKLCRRKSGEKCLFSAVTCVDRLVTNWIQACGSLLWTRSTFVHWFTAWQSQNCLTNADWATQFLVPDKSCTMSIMPRCKTSEKKRAKNVWNNRFKCDKNVRRLLV